MAAKKLCDKCGKSMAANHYWYKGGWRCKGAKNAAAENGTQPHQTAPVVQGPKAISIGGILSLSAG